jgi:hypothetical protein
MRDSLEGNLKNRHFAMIACLWLTSCSANTINHKTGGLPPAKLIVSAATTFDKTTMEIDKHEEVVRFYGPEIKESPGLIDPRYHLRAWRDTKAGSTTHYQLVVSAMASDWMNLDRAISYGKRFEVTTVHKFVVSCTSGCMIHESVGVKMTLADLERAAAKPVFEIKVSGRDERVVEVQSAYIQGFLKKVRESKTS